MHTGEDKKTRAAGRARGAQFLCLAPFLALLLGSAGFLRMEVILCLLMVKVGNGKTTITTFCTDNYVLQSHHHEVHLCGLTEMWYGLI